MKILYYDCFAGISGDMNLGAMIDLGIPVSHLTQGLRKLPLEGYEIKIQEDRRRGLRGTKVDVLTEGDHHQHHPRRTLTDIERIITTSLLSDEAKKTSLKIFRHLAEAEARVHGEDIAAIHFHEVGAVDAIVDIVGAAICLEFLRVDRIFSTPVELGGGVVTCAHGTLPVPAPATLELLRGVPVRSGLVPYETTTPTGAAILVGIVDEFTERMQFKPLQIGCGLGTRDLEIPNVLRLVLGEMPKGNQRQKWDTDEAVLIECNIDDMNPELYDYVMDLLFEAGAQDVFLTPIIMKKSRPAVVLNVLCRPGDTETMKEILLTETSTIGARSSTVEKAMLRREQTIVKTIYGDISVKQVYLGERLIRSKPEYEDCKRRAKEHGVPIGDIYRSVNAEVPGQDG